MPCARYFVDAPLEGEVSLSGDEFMHLMRVMRAQENDTLELVNGHNKLASARILSIHKTHAHIKIISVTEGKTKKPFTLVQALIRPQLLDWVIEKGTELNVTTFHLFPAEKSEKKTLPEAQLTRLHKLTISALKQCGRLDLPKIAFFSHLSQVPLHGKGVFGDVRKKESSLCSADFFCVGPEAGFTEQEHAFLEKQGVLGIRLHDNTLRTETAALVGTALLQSSAHTHDKRNDHLH